MKRFIPLLAVLFILAVLAALYAPGLLTRMALSRSVSALLESAEAGDRNGIIAMIEPGQQQSFAELLERHAPPGFEEYIESLSRRGMEKAGSDRMMVMVNCRLQTGGGPAIYQARLAWQYSGTRWEWDPAGSLAAPFSTSGEPSWIKLGDLLALEGAGS